MSIAPLTPPPQEGKSPILDRWLYLAWKRLIASISTSDTSQPNAPSALNLAEETILLRDGTTASRLRVSWDKAEDALPCLDRVEIKQGDVLIDVSDTSDAEYVSTIVPEGVEYTVNVYTERRCTAVRSEALAGTITPVGRTVLPGDVTNFGVGSSTNSSYFEATWTRVSGAVIDKYVIKYVQTPYPPPNQQWELGIEASTIGGRESFALIPSPKAPAGYRFMIKAVDTSGNESAVFAYNDVIVTSPAQVTLTASVTKNNITLTWDNAATAYPITYYSIREGSATYALATETLRCTDLTTTINKAKAGGYHFHVTAVDIFNNAGTPAYVLATVEQAYLDTAIAKGFDPAKVTVSDPVADMLRWSSAGNKWERYNGTAWVDMTATYAISISGNAATATTATTATNATQLGGVAAASYARLDAIPTFAGGATGAEGGEIRLLKPPSGTTVAGDLIVDIVGDMLRIFEGGASYRGAHLYITECGAGIGAKLWHSNNDGSGSGLDADLLDGLNAIDFARSGYQPSADLNTVLTTGFYRIDTNANRPYGVDYGQLIVAHGGSTDTLTQIATDFGGRYIYWRAYGAATWSPWVKLKGQTFVEANSAYAAKPNEVVVQYGAYDVTLPQGGLLTTGDEVSVCFTGSVSNYVRRGAAGGYLGGMGVMLAEDMLIDKTFTWVTFRYFGSYWVIV